LNFFLFNILYANKKPLNENLFKFKPSVHHYYLSSKSNKNEKLEYAKYTLINAEIEETFTLENDPNILVRLYKNTHHHCIKIFPLLY
jgi:hypothetical protein